MEHITVKEIIEATKGTLLCGSTDVALRHISIDSRTMKGGDLFVPLVGEKVDAHNFISQAFSNGAAAVLTEKDGVEPSDSLKPHIHVKDTKTALQDIGRYYRSRVNLPLVGITGSVGKTTTREMIAAALTAGFQVYKTPANHNSQVGVPITISEISSTDEIGVIELGMSEPGELTIIAQIACIDMAVITNVGITHIEQLGSQENIYKEKISIQDGLKPGGILFLNGDDELLRKTTARDSFRTIYYGTGENCSYRAEHVVLQNGYPCFEAVRGDERVPVTLHVMGNHNVLNAMVALAVACECGIPMAKAAEGLKRFEGFKNRQQVYSHDGITVIDDTYNASPVSMKAAIEVLCSLEAPARRIAVLADMKELGPQADCFHREVGEYLAAQRVDLLVTLGALAKEIAKGASEAGHKQIIEFDDKQELIEYLKQEIKQGDGILFKGSNSMRLNEVAAVFIQ